mgnify:CR=1 FL=1
MFPNKQTKEDFKFKIANIITEIRYDNKWTQKKIAQITGLKQSAISRIESGAQIPSLTTLFKIANKCGFNLFIKIKK